MDYDAIPDYAQGVQEAIAPLRGLLGAGHAGAVVELAEYALIELDKVSHMLDGGDGSLHPIYDDLQRFHLARLPAARAAGELRAADKREAIDHRRFQLQALMETLAESEGDTDLLVAVKERDLSSAHDYLSLAELHAAHGKDRDAINRAEEGLRLFGAEGDTAGLRDFLISAYERTGQAPRARELAWQAFLDTGDAPGYRRLREHFRLTAADDWPAWRERALTHLRGRVDSEVTAARDRHPSHPPDGSVLVEILLEEHRHEAAWREALAHGCRVDLWLRLAAKREKKNPADALGVYQARLHPTIAAGGPTAYREAIALLDKIRVLLDRLGRSGDFAPYRDEVRAAHRQKRGFLKLLDASGR